MTVPRLRPANERLAGAVAILSEFNPLRLELSQCFIDPMESDVIVIFYLVPRTRTKSLVSAASFIRLNKEGLRAPS